jgi:hypothetical protein
MIVDRNANVVTKVNIHEISMRKMTNQEKKPTNIDKT